MTTIIKAHIPYGKFEVIKDGEKLNNLIGFIFKADVENIPTITLDYGDIYKDIEDSIISRITALNLSNDVQKVKIEINSNNDVSVYINNIEQKFVQDIVLKTELYGENTMKVTYILGV